MAWDTPWFVGAPAQHSERIARAFAFIATGGAEGVAQPGDLKVSATAVPSGQLNVAVGGGLFKRRGGDSYEQSYVGVNSTPDTVAPAATGSTGGQSDLIIARVEDPNAVGGTAWANNGASPSAGPFVFDRIIPNVPPTTRTLQELVGHETDTGFALARLDKPANTGTFTDAMLVDLRKLARARTETQNAGGALTDATLTLSTGSWQNFPTNPITGLLVPDWATHAVVTVFTTMRYVSGDARANFQAFMSTVGGPIDGTTLFSDSIIDMTTGNGYRQPVIIPTQGDWAIPASLRGKAVQLTSRVRGQANGGKIGTATSDYYTATVTFKEKAA